MRSMIRINARAGSRAEGTRPGSPRERPLNSPSATRAWKRTPGSPPLAAGVGRRSSNWKSTPIRTALPWKAEGSASRAWAKVRVGTWAGLRQSGVKTVPGGAFRPARRAAKAWRSLSPAPARPMIRERQTPSLSGLRLK